MNTAELKGDWQQFVERAGAKWGPLTNDDRKLVEGRRDQLLVNIQQRYGVSLEEAEHKLAGLVRVLTLGMALGALPGSTRSPAGTRKELLGERDGN
jgi:uncharacterized protein YjbJ (UPF0337 family)